MKKTLSIFLALITILSCFGTGFAYLSDTLVETEYPSVYLHGQGGAIRAWNENRKLYNVYPVEYDTDEILDKVNLLHGPFARGVLTGDWDEWCDTFVEIVAPLFESYALDENGEATENTYFWNLGEIRECRLEDGNFSMLDFSFNYDWRLDPYATADAMERYIDNILKLQKVDKVNIVGRCIGGNAVLAYLDKYGTSKVNKVMFYCEGFEGFEMVGRLFTGDIVIDPSALTRFVDDYFSDADYADDEIYGLLIDLVSILNTMKTLDVAVDALAGVYDQVYENVMPRILLRSFGTMPSFWALIGDDYYEDAKKFVFGDDTETYAKLIEKTDHFHYDCLNRYKDIITVTEESGTDVYNITKYGFQIAPLVENVYLQSDSMLELWSASAGATCSPINCEFNKEYILSAETDGTAKYISPDRQVDASTCILPDNTWFIKNMSHMYMPDIVHVMAAEILNFDGDMTVFDNENYPQYLVYDKAEDTLLPQTEENADTRPNWKKNFFEHIVSFWKRLWSIIKGWFAKTVEEKFKTGE